MPVKKAGTKNKFTRAKRKIKDAGLSLMLAAAALAPMRGAAQSVTGDKNERIVELVVNAINMGITITNASSPDKKIDIKEWGCDLYNQPFYFATDCNNAFNAPEPGDIANATMGDSYRYGSAAPSRRLLNLIDMSITRNGAHEYIYNTDTVFDMYLERLRERMPDACNFPTKNMRIDILCIGPFEQIDLYNVADGGNKWVASMIYDNEIEDVVCFSSDVHVRVYHDASDRLPVVRIFDGTTIRKTFVSVYRGNVRDISKER